MTKNNKLNRDSSYICTILSDVTGINLTKEEEQKLSVYLRFETVGEQLFESINSIYALIAANFTKPSEIIIIPFIRAGKEHINIQRIGDYVKESAN